MEHQTLGPIDPATKPIIILKIVGFLDCWYRHVKNTPTLTLHIIAYKCHEGSRNVNTYQKLPEARSWMTTLKKGKINPSISKIHFIKVRFKCIPGFLLNPILWIESIVLTFTYHHYFYAPVSFHKILLLCYCKKLIWWTKTPKPE